MSRSSSTTVATQKTPTTKSDFEKRWDAEILAIRGEFQEQLADAEAASIDMIESQVEGFPDLATPWQMLSAKMHEATEKLSEAWERFDEEQDEHETLSDDDFSRQERKLGAETTEIELDFRRSHDGIMAKLGQSMFERMNQENIPDYTCQHCGGALALDSKSALSTNVECSHCQSICTINPTLLRRIFAGSGAQALAKAEAFPHYESSQRLLVAIEEYRESKDVPLELLKQFEASQMLYWKTLIQREADYVPDKAKDVERLLEPKLKGVQKMLKRYRAWQEHNRA